VFICRLPQHPLECEGSGQQQTDRLDKGEEMDMPRIPPAENFEPSSQEGEGAESAKAMSALFRVMAQRPELARDSLRLLETAMRGGTVDPRLKELLAVRVSQVNHCYY
jgi:alkylhydroperoxidase family enzyme